MYYSFVDPFKNVAINISTAIEGPVVLELKGFSITGPGFGSGPSTGVSIGIISREISNTFPITIRNGTIANFVDGIATNTSAQLRDITINNMVFEGTRDISIGVSFAYVASSTIKNCTSSNTINGIGDLSSPGGNSYNNDTFVQVQIPITISGPPIGSPMGGYNITLDHCQFATPRSN